MQDFEVIYIQNSDESEQSTSFQIVEISDTRILVQLSFEKPILVSQGKIQDRVTVKLNKDLFLFPSKFRGKNTIKRLDESPFTILSSRLPKMLGSETEKEVVDSVGTSTGKVMITMTVIPIIAGIVFKGLKAKLWAMLNTF